MLEVIARFPAIGTIQAYRALPRGERALYNEFTKLKLKEEAKAVIRLDGLKKK